MAGGHVIADLKSRYEEVQELRKALREARDSAGVMDSETKPEADAAIKSLQLSLAAAVTKLAEAAAEK